MEKEKLFKASNGYLMLLLAMLSITSGLYGLIAFNNPYYILLFIVFVFIGSGLFIINPNESIVLILFGKYSGSVKENGFFWAMPFYKRRKISLRARNFDSNPIKVNDKLANPIKIGVVVVWKVRNTYKSVFDVNDFEHFVNVQTDSAIRKLAGSYAYDNFDDDEVELTLRSGGEEIDMKLETMLRERLEIAGIEIIEARINYLAYAEEIAQAMLKRQQATAIIAARIKIVEGAVSMVEMALKQLSENNIVELDDERKAAMVSNLMVVLVSDKDASPIVNTSSLY